MTKEGSVLAVVNNCSPNPIVWIKLLASVYGWTGAGMTCRAVQI